jgi:hypothetical protein
VGDSVTVAEGVVVWVAVGEGVTVGVEDGVGVLLGVGVGVNVTAGRISTSLSRSSRSRRIHPPSYSRNDSI